MSFDTNNDISDLKNVMFPTTSSKKSYTSDGFGGLKAVGGGNSGMPQMDHFMGGLMHDLYMRDNLNKVNYKENKNAANMFLETSNKAANNFQDPNSSGQRFFDQAQEFSQAGLRDSQKAEDRLNSQLTAAGKSQEAAHKNALGMYDKAIAQSSQGTDQIASAMSAAAQRKGADQQAQIANEMSGALPGTESQLQDAARTNQRNMNEAVFSGVSAIQDRANQFQATLFSGKAQLAGSLADASAQFQSQSAQIGFNANQSKNKWNELSATIAQNNAGFQLQNNQAFMNAVQSIGINYADMIRQNPIMGVTVMPTLMAMGELSEQYGNQGIQSIPNPNAGAFINRSNTWGAQSWMPGAGALRDKLSEQSSREFANMQGVNYVPNGGRQTIEMYGSGGGPSMSFSSPNRIFDHNFSTAAGQQALQDSRDRRDAVGRRA